MRGVGDMKLASTTVDSSFEASNAQLEVEESFEDSEKPGASEHTKKKKAKRKNNKK
jgi:hypothetical protein